MPLAGLNHLEPDGFRIGTGTFVRVDFHEFISTGLGVQSYHPDTPCKVTRSRNRKKHPVLSLPND